MKSMMSRPSTAEPGCSGFVGCGTDTARCEGGSSRQAANPSDPYNAAMPKSGYSHASIHSANEVDDGEEASRGSARQDFISQPHLRQQFFRPTGCVSGEASQARREEETGAQVCECSGVDTSQASAQGATSTNSILDAALGDQVGRFAGSKSDVLNSFLSAESVMSSAATPQYSFVQLASAALQHRCSEQRHLEGVYQSRFHSIHIPHISMVDYLKRIAKYSTCSSECFLIGIIFIDRYCTATGIPITFRNIHRLTITAVMLAAKLRDDQFYSNAYYSSIGGVSNSELNALEIELLSTIEWRTWVERAEFEAYRVKLWQAFGESLNADESWDGVSAAPS